MPYGLCIGTHHTNATGTIINYPECRGCCVDEAVNYLLDLYSDNYETQMSQMSERQRTLFRAITAEGTATGITGGAFIRKYRLWSPSSVMSAAKALLEKDLITQEHGAYSIYDQFFALWRLREL